MLVPTEYKTLHDRVAKYIQWNICNFYGKDHVRNWYEHHPDAVTDIDLYSFIGLYNKH